MSIFEDTYPLIAGYLTAYALKDPRLAEAFEFNSRDFGPRTPIEDISAEIKTTRHDVYALSCYVWNMAAMRETVSVIRDHQPDALIVLGGPQVINEADNILSADDNRMIICNGEGEKTFSNILRTLLDGTSYKDVAGISSVIEGKVTTNKPEPRIQDLDSIPSPYLADLFPGRYQMGVIETNRGCPFRCSFCYWGAANNDRVYKFDEARIREEITQFGKRRMARIYLADANWGMLKRDVELTKHVIDCNKKYSAPLTVIFSSSKNSPRRVEEITELLAKNGMMNTQTVSLQSLNERALETIDRQNIKLENYMQLQADLNNKNIGSYIELIWPLPGETLKTFLTGLADLMRADARTLIIYPNMLLKNTPMFHQQNQLGIKTRKPVDTHSEEEFIVETSDASADDVQEGMLVVVAVHSLFNAKSAVTLMGYLDKSGTMPTEDFLNQFAKFLYQHRTSEIGRFVRHSVDRYRLTEFGNSVDLLHHILHRNRAEFSQILREFCEQFAWWQDDEARLAFELDVFRKPYLFGNTLPEFLGQKFEFFNVSATESKMRAIKLDVLGAPKSVLADCLPGNVGHNSGLDNIFIVHPEIKASYTSKWAAQELYHYGNGYLTSIDRALPEISTSDTTELIGQPPHTNRNYGNKNSDSSSLSVSR